MSEPMPEWGEALPDNSTVGLLHQQFGKVLIPVEEVRLAFYRNLNQETFRRVLRSFRIPLPVITLDVSEKAQSYICIYQLAAYIEHRAIEAATAQRHVLFTTSTRDRRLHQRLIDAVPITQFRDVATATPKTQA